MVLLIGTSFSRIEKKYPIPPRDEGFKIGYRAKVGYVIPFAYGPDGIYFVDDYDPVYSDLELYILPKVSKNVTIEVVLLRRIQVNKTYYYYEEVKRVNKTMKLDFFELAHETIELPTLDEKLLALLYIDEEEILRFYYRFNIYFQKVETSVGDLFVTQIIGMIIAIVIYLIALAIARAIANITATPEADIGKAIMYFLLFGLMAIYVAKTVIFEYGLYQSIYFYPAMFLVALLSAIYVVSPPARGILLIKTTLEETGTATLITYKTRVIKGTMYVVPNMLEFLFYKTRKIMADKKTRIFRTISDDYDYIIYFEEVDEKGDKIKITTSDIHKMRVEDYKSNIRKIYTFSRVIEEQKERIKDLEIRLQIETYREALDILRRMRREVTWRKEQNQ